MLVVAAEDYTGTSNVPPYASATEPNYLSYYTDALDANGVSFDVYDVDARGRIAPDSAGVLGHYDAVVWYTGNDLLTREPGQPGGTGAATLANNEMLELRAYLNEGGRLLYTGRSAGWQYANAFDYNPVSTPPLCDNVDQSVDDGCLLLSDDFLQYWLGAYLFIEDGGTDAETGEPFPLAGNAGTLVRRDSTGRSTAVTAPTTTTRTPHVARPSRSSPRPACSSRTTSHSSPATRSRHGRPVWPGRSARTPAATTSTPNRSDLTYKRLMHTIDLTGVSPGANSETCRSGRPTTPKRTGTSSSSRRIRSARTTGPRCPTRTVTPARTSATRPSATRARRDGTPIPSTRSIPSSPTTRRGTAPTRRAIRSGTTGEWNASSGRSDGWENWSIDLSAYAGSEVEVSISYVSDWGVQGIGSFVDDVTVSTEGTTESFETDLGAWTVAGPAPGSQINANDWTRTTDVGFEEGAVVAMAPTDARFPDRLLRVRL